MEQSLRILHLKYGKTKALGAFASRQQEKTIRTGNEITHNKALVHYVAQKVFL